MPEVGLELHSLPCKHWTPAETCGIRPDPAHVRPDPKPKVCTLYTPQIWPVPRIRTKPHPSSFDCRKSPLIADISSCWATCLIRRITGPLSYGLAHPDLIAAGLVNEGAPIGCVGRQPEAGRIGHDRFYTATSLGDSPESKFDEKPLKLLPVFDKAKRCSTRDVGLHKFSSTSVLNFLGMEQLLLWDQ